VTVGSDLARRARHEANLKNLFVVAAALTMPIAALLQSPSSEAWIEADRATIRLDPETFTELPRTLQIELRHRGCSIPQPFASLSRQNVIHGSFTRSAHVDWAVLCSRELTSAILVFRDGNPNAVEELGRRPDADFLQGTGPNQIGFSRAISVASAAFIHEHHKWYGGPVPPPVITHAGIDDAFVEKASVVWYRHAGKWLQLTGSN
jgi:hypothetical protein